MKHLLSTIGMEREAVMEILRSARQMEEAAAKGEASRKLEGKIVASIFFEPSTRTRLSFETAALKLGAQVISAENAENNSSAFKGESIEDTFRMLSSYADIIIMRHKESGALERGAEASSAPVINAGDGANQHPTQALLDLYTIEKETGRLENLSIAFVGDLLYGRTLHSFLPLLNLYPNNKFYFVSPKELALPEKYRAELNEKKVEFIETQNLEEALKRADALYMTRVQKERFADAREYEKVKDSFLLKYEHLRFLRDKSVILHPLPRLNEIDPRIDADPRAAYFRQAQNGLYVRMAILPYVLGL